MHQLEHLVLIFSDLSEITLRPPDILSFDATDFREQITTIRDISDKQTVVCDMRLSIAPNAKKQIRAVQRTCSIAQIHIIDLHGSQVLYPIWLDALDNPDQNKHQQTRQFEDGSLTVWLATGTRFKL